ncbi:unnamed protein product [Somion occarium]|uniref:Uncharacterized protein n=1 Tax=Somion occarium TaxID=3059160 RepID=A0ABP1D601_9APHY
MPTSLRALVVLAALSLVSNSQARPAEYNPVGSDLSPSIPGPALPMEPASLLGRSYTHQKRDPLIIMDPALNKGMVTPVPSTHPPPSSHKSTTKKKVKTRQLPIPSAQDLSGLTDLASNHRRGETHPVNYLSNVEAVPPPRPESPAPTSEPIPEPVDPQFPEEHYRPYRVKEAESKEKAKEKSKKKEEEKKHEGKSESKWKSKDEKKKGKDH